MANSNDEFLKKLLATFRVEAQEHIEAMSSAILALERAAPGSQAPIVEQIFREAHSLKGAARAVNLGDIETVCHSLESVFSLLKGGRLAATETLFDLGHESLDVLRLNLAADASSPESAARAGAIVARLDRHVRSEPARVAPATGSAAEAGEAPGAAREKVAIAGPATVSGTTRVETEKLDAIMRQTEELLGPRLAGAQRLTEIRENRAVLARWKRDRHSISSGQKALDALLAAGESNPRALGEVQKIKQHLDSEAVFLSTLDSRLSKFERVAERDQRTMANMLDSLLHDVKEAHMLPLSTVVDALPRLLRDVAREQRKRVELVLRGGDLQVDRRVLEELKAPLQHLLRNAVDHGIELPAIREQNGKPAEGTILIAASAKDSRVELRISDDGAGIDPAAVRDAADRLGLLPRSEIERFSDQDLAALVFQSGLSTSATVTSLSGRGLGLAIVREKIEALGGSVRVETDRGAGTSVHMEIPLTLATFRGVLVRSGGRLLILPTAYVERVARVPAAEIRTVQNRETISLSGRSISLVSLDHVLDLSPIASDAGGAVPVVILAAAADRIAFRVDEVVGEQEVLVKPLGPQLVRVRNVSAATVLGSGEIVPILNVSDLMRSAVRAAAGGRAAEPVEPPPEKRSVLVVEDSITSRTLLKNILEAAGYDVAVAVDGVDAYTTLKTRSFDLIVSDVEMPRMDGFDLTARVRADEQLADLPIVLVTALDRPEHRERGIDVGANAYIVKSGFDQAHLLEAIRRLI